MPNVRSATQRHCPNPLPGVVRRIGEQRKIVPSLQTLTDHLNAIRAVAQDAVATIGVALAAESND